MAMNGLFCADVLLRNYSLTHSGQNNKEVKFNSLGVLWWVRVAVVVRCGYVLSRRRSQNHSVPSHNAGFAPTTSSAGRKRDNVNHS